MTDKKPEELGEDELSDVTGGLLAHEVTHIAKSRIPKAKGDAAVHGSIEPNDGLKSGIGEQEGRGVASSAGGDPNAFWRITDAG